MKRIKHSKLPEEIETEESSELEEKLDVSDANFKSELDYDGYRSLEESDNNAYNSRDLERNMELKGDLRIEDREGDSSSGEESLVDPQENKK